MSQFKLLTGINKERIFTMVDMVELGFESINNIKLFCIQYYNGETDYQLIFNDNAIMPDIIILNDELYEDISYSLNIIYS